MKRLQLALILPCVLFSFPGFAEEQSLINPQHQGDVSFVSGGVGADERDAMQAIRANYDLNLLFSVKGSGEYLSDVKVRIADSKDNTVLDTVSDGPKLFANVKPGRYLVTVDSDGQVIHKTATVGGKRATTLLFTWPPEKGN